MIRRLSRIVLLVSLPFLVVLLISFGQRFPVLEKPLHLLDRLVFGVTTPILGTVQYVRRGASAIVHRYFDLVETERENEALKRSVANFKLQQLYYETLVERTARLEALLGFQESQPFEAIAAHVVSYPPLAEFRLLIIDRGSEDGVERGAAVIVPEGLVGRIWRVEKKIAQVLLIVDPMSAVDARVQRTGARGLVVGYGKGIGLSRELYIGALEYWEQTQEVREGDLLMTSGQDGIFPADLPVGVLRSVRRGNKEVFLEGEVTPVVPFHKLREVLVLKRP